MEFEEPRLVDTGKGFNIKYKNRNLYSTIDPVSSVVKRVRKMAMTDKTLFFVPSLGLGYGMEEILERLPESSHVLCIETDQKLMALALSRRPAALPDSPHLTIIRTDSPSAAVHILRDIGVSRFRRLRVVYLCGAYHLYQSLYDEIAGSLEREIHNYWKNRMTIIHMGHLWVKNIILNLRDICVSPDISVLSTDLPVLVAGAGPSLESSLPLIHDLRQRVLLLACDTALPVLADVGIRPDLIFALESQVANLQDFIGHSYSDVPLLCDISCSPPVVRLFKGRTYFFSSDFYPLRLLRRMAEKGLLPFSMPPLGSVGVAALYAALMLTDGPVFLAGLDFSYAGNKTHSRGAPVNRLMLRSARRLVPIGQLIYELILKRPLVRLERRNGKKILSDLILHGYAEELTEVTAPEKRVFDLGGESPDMGIPVLKQSSEIERMVANRKSMEAFRKGPLANGPVPDDADPAGAYRMCSLFEESERKRLEGLIEFAAEYLKSRAGSPHTGKISVELSSEQAEQLEDLDYLYFHFPEGFPGGEPTLNVLARVYASACRFLEVWNRWEQSTAR